MIKVKQGDLKSPCFTSRLQKSTPYARHISVNGKFDARYDWRGNLSWSRHIHNTSKGSDILHWHTELPHSGEYYSYQRFLIALIFRR